jgi:hypothetical protein
MGFRPRLQQRTFRIILEAAASIFKFWRPRVVIHWHSHVAGQERIQHFVTSRVQLNWTCAEVSEGLRKRRRRSNLRWVGQAAPRFAQQCFKWGLSYILMLYLYLYGARGDAFGWGTALQTGKSRVRFPMVPLEFFINYSHYITHVT